MATQLQKLLFSIDLLDRISGPVGKIQKRMNAFTSGVTAAFGKIGIGAAGMLGAGYALEKIVSPAIEVNRALGEVKSLDVTQDALDKLNDTALKFSMNFGGAATDFIRSAYDIQSAIAGLSGDELSRFTNAGNVLAKGTKSDAATITDYMGTMYGIFKNTADAMGKAQWVEQLTGQTATAVQMFKTTGSEMASAFSSIGANATAAGIDASEQMAVLGTLQSQMSGSEAGTTYRAFLNGVGQAQGQLGLSFTDSSGRMLGMVEILERLRKKFGTIDTVAESDALKKAFGSDEAVGLIKALLADTDGLAESIDKLGKVSGMDRAVKMAKDMTDPWQQLAGVIQAVRIAFAQALLPVITPVIARLADGGKVIARWTKMFPNLTRWVGYGTLAVIGLTAAFGALAVVGGVLSLVMIALSSPVVLIVAGILLLIAAVAAVIIWWDKFKAAVADSAVFRLVIFMIGGPVLQLAAVIAMVVTVWERLKAAFLGSEWGQAVISAIADVLEWWKNLKDTLLDFDWLEWMAKKFDWLADKLSWLPGFGGRTGVSVDEAPSLGAPRTVDVPPGGISKQITQSIDASRTQNNGRTIGTVNINTSQPLSPAALSEMLFMGAGV